MVMPQAVPERGQWPWGQQAASGHTIKHSQYPKVEGCIQTAPGEQLEPNATYHVSRECWTCVKSEFDGVAMQGNSFEKDSSLAPQFTEIAVELVKVGFLIFLLKDPLGN